MNKKVLKVMLVLVVVVLLFLYVAKLFFPEQFVLVVENKNIVAIGNYIQTHLWADLVFGILSSFATYSMYLCAVCQKWRLNWKEIILVLVTIGINIGLSYWNAGLASHFSIASMLILPLICKSNLKNVAIVFSVHGLAQVLSLMIRNLPMYMT